MKTLNFLIATFLLLFAACTRPTETVSPEPVSPPTSQTPAIVGEHILIDTKSRALYVKRDDEVLAFFPGLAFSPEGPGIKKKRGDGVTPLGEFRVSWKTRASDYRAFIGFNYPTPEYAKRGLEEGVISEREFQTIVRAHEEGRAPPQNTGLGGHIGIHGLGNRPLHIHRISHWTRGCIAVDNSQIEELWKFVKVGMRVFVR
jgi:lipoprotein-anchoring transpeptidase ErfK/SrfK